MKIERQSDIALRLLVLAPSARWTVEAASKAVGVPVNHVAKVVRRLRELGLVTTFPGKNGGFERNSAALQSSVGQILRDLEGGSPAVKCDDPPCPLLSGGCLLRRRLAEAQEAFFQSLDDLTVADLLDANPSPVFVELN